MSTTLYPGRSRLTTLLILVALLVIVASLGMAAYLWLTSHSHPDPATVLDEQVAAWNAGDLDRFLATYWDSEHLTYYSGGTVNQGIAATRERFHQRYRAKGHLTFTNVEVTPLADDAALIRARWKLVLSKETPGGLFTLLLRKFPDGWKIVHDHTSLAEPAKTP